MQVRADEWELAGTLKETVAEEKFTCTAFAFWSVKA